MAVEEIKVVPSNGKDLAFNGELIAHANSDRNATPVGERWFELRVYREVGQGFVPVIDYFSTYEGEQDVTIAEFVDCSHDIENFYYVFEPSLVIPEPALKLMPVEDRQRLLNSILKIYDAPVNRVLLAVKEHPTKEDANVRSPKAEQAGQSTFFGRKN